MILLKLYRRLSKILYNITVFSVSTFVIIIFLLINAQIFLRGIGISFAQTAEIARYSMVYMTLWGISSVFKDGGHLKTEFLVEKLPIQLKKVIEIIIYLLILFFAYMIIKHGYRYAVFSQSRISPVGINFYYITLCIPTGGFLLIIQVIDQMIEKYLGVEI